MLNLMKLENRIVLDAAGMDAAADHAGDADMDDVGPNPETESASLTPDADHSSETIAAAASLLSGAEEDAAPLDVVLISDNLPDVATLRGAVRADAALIEYDADAESAQDVVDRVTAAADQSGRSIGSVTVLSHGGSGFFQLGNEIITADTLPENAAAWNALDQVMEDGGRIHLMGCNVAADSDAGQALLDGMAEATHATVFSSDDVTGKGGDWELETASDAEAGRADLPLDVALLGDYAGQLQDPPVQFVPPTEVFGREDARSGIVITLFVRDDVDPDSLQIQATPSAGDEVIRLSDIDQPAPGSQVPYNPQPGQVRPPTGYTGFTWVAFYSPRANQFHPNGDETPITVSVQSENGGPDVDATETYTLTVDPLNDAPFLRDGLESGGDFVDDFQNVGTIDIGTVEEDAEDPAGVPLSTLVNPAILDVDDGDPTGIAIIGTDVGGGGVWQYNSGGGWVDVGQVSAESALVLASDVQVRFLPQGQWSQDQTEATLEFRAWDQTDGNASGTTGVNTEVGPRPSEPGDTAAYSKATGNLRVEVIPVNNPPEPPTVEIDDPYIENGFVTPDDVDVPMELNITLNEDPDDTEFTEVVVEITDGYQNDGRGEDVLFLAGTLPSTIEANIATGEGGARRVVLTPANGEASATISDFQLAVDQLRFEHVGGNDLLDPGEAANALNGDDPIERARIISVTVSDANASEADNGIQDSTGEDDFLVDAVNDGPDATPETDTLTYSLNTSNPTRLALADDSFAISDLDDAALAGSGLPRGISEIQVRIGNGYTAAVDTLEFDDTGFSDVDATLQDGGRTLVLTAAAGEALSLDRAEAALQQVSYVNTAADAAQANEGADREITITLTDNNSGGDGDFFQNQDPEPTQPQFLDGPKSAEVTRTIQIEADAPPELDFGEGIFEDNGNPNEPFFAPREPAQVEGFAVQDIVRNFNLPNQPPNQGSEALAITAVDDRNGQWQFLNSAGQWTPINDGQLGEDHALLLGATDQIRFIPDADFNTDEEPGAVTPTISAKSWDTSEFAGTAGSYVNTVGNNVGFSQEGEGELPVLAVNDRPDIILGPNLDPDNNDVVEEEQRLDENGEITFTGITLQDIDLAKGEAAGANPGEIDLTISVEQASSQVFLDQLAGVTIVGGSNGSQSVTIRGSLSNVSAAIQSGLRYEADMDDLENAPANAPYDTVTITSDDLGNAGRPGPLTDADNIRINIFPGDSPPDIDLDADDDGGADPDDNIPPAGPQAPGNDGTGNFNVFFIEDSDCRPVQIADADVLIADDSGQIQRMTLELTNRLDQDAPNFAPEQGEERLALDQNAAQGLLESLGFDQAVLDAVNADPNTNITVNLTQQTNAAGQVIGLTLDFQGVASTQAYQQILDTVTYDNDSQNPQDTAPDGQAVRRVVSVTVTDVPQDGEGPGQSSTAYSRIAIVPVNDAPENVAPGLINIPSNTQVDIGGQLDVGDLEGPAEMSVNLGVIFGVLNVEPAAGVEIDGNGTADLTLTGAIEAVNAVLDTLAYSPPDNFNGDDTLTITSNDFGYEGINPNFVQKNGVRCVVASQGPDGNPIVDERGNLVPDGTDEKTPNDRDALTDVDAITLRVAISDPDALPEPATPPPGPPLQPIITPDADGPDDLSPGPVNLPGMVGLTEGRAGIFAEGRAAGGEDFAPDFCSIEEALRSHLGCRFANTLNPEAQFGSLSWGDMTDLGWKPPSLYLDEEYDLYSRLFLKEAGDPGFNVEAGAFGVDLGGLPDQPEAVFQEGTGEETFNEMEPNEIREAFFANRKNLDRTWR